MSAVARGAWQALLAAVLLLGAADAARAHDVAGQLRLHAFVQAVDGKLVAVVRVPLELMLNVDLPKRGDGYIDLARVDEAVPRALQAVAKDIVFLDGGRRLALTAGEGRVALPSDRSFESFERAAAAVRGERLALKTDVYWNQGYFDALLEYRLDSAAADLALDFRVAPGLRDRLRLDLRYVMPGGEVRAYELVTGGDPTALDPRWHQAAWTFVQSGFRHILGGADHLLFLICLVVPFRRMGWPLVGVVTAFTVAHSVTLSAAALGWVPSDPAFPLLVEVLIAGSIVYMAVDNLFSPSARARWILTAAFGLVHGFGFSFALANELQFAGSHLALSLLAFNVGIEAGQLLVIAIAWPAIAWVGAKFPHAERMLVAVISGFVAHAAWHWMSERYEALSREDWTGLVGSVVSPSGLVVVLLLVAVGMGFKALRRRPSVLARGDGNS